MYYYLKKRKNKDRIYLLRVADNVEWRGHSAWWVAVAPGGITGAHIKAVLEFRSGLINNRFLSVENPKIYLNIYSVILRL